jgi:hypothetical protein
MPPWLPPCGLQMRDVWCLVCIVVASEEELPLPRNQARSGFGFSKRQIDFVNGSRAQNGKREYRRLAQGDWPAAAMTVQTREPCSHHRRPLSHKRCTFPLFDFSCTRCPHFRCSGTSGARTKGRPCCFVGPGKEAQPGPACHAPTPPTVCP